MTDERKRELEYKLDNIVSELENIVTETGYGYSIMVLPTEDKGSTVCAFIHECKSGRGIMQIHDVFIGAFDKEFEYNEEDNEDE